MRFDAFLIPTPTLTLNLPLKQCKYIIGQPIRSLGRLYTSGLSDKDMGKIILRQLSEGLSKIDASQLPGKYKVWCYHFTLYQRVMWPLKLCEVTSSAVSRMEAKANCFIRKWLGLPWCFSAAGLYWELSASHHWFQVLWLPRQFDRLITGIVGGACKESDE